MKKNIILLITALCVCTAVFPQEKKNALYPDLGIIILNFMDKGSCFGLLYERRLTDNFSALGYAGFRKFSGNSMYGTSFRFQQMSFGLRGRYYPFSIPPRGWFIDLGGNYNHIQTKMESTEVYHIYDAALATGWKFVSRPGFYIEPALRYRIAWGNRINGPYGETDALLYEPFSVQLYMGWVF